MESYDQEPDFVVVKFGTQTVTNEFGMDDQRLVKYSGGLARLAQQYRLIVVSSGSIATGRAMWKEEGNLPLDNDEDYAAIGSADAYRAWEEVLGRHNIFCAQIPVTNHEIDTKEGEVLKERLISLTGNWIIPIANGNDVLSHEGVEENKIDTDNDRLARHIAQLVSAKHLLLLTDKPGVQNHRGETYHKVETLNDENTVISLTGTEGGGEKGGMRSKVKEAITAQASGIHAHIASSDAKYFAVISSERGTGTHFPARSS